MSALGAVALAFAAFVPWYRVSELVHGSVSSAAPRSLAIISSHHALPVMQAFLLVLVGLAMLDAMLPLLRTSGPIPGGAGGSVALLGALAAACALYRILDPPSLGGETVVVSLLAGPWLALLSSLLMMLGGMWPRHVGSAQGAQVHMRSTLSW
ncbi:MAG TPA: hypothetical protein VIH71_17755 [Solirubrobacteraceae bacterium]